jgi:outer membrane protein assembly factor BamA
VVKERWYLIPEITFQLADRNFNVWWTEKNKDISRSIIGVSLTHKNFRGNREQIGVTAQIGYKKQFSVHYLKPYIDKKQKHGLGFEVGVSQNQELFYTTDSNKLQFVRMENKPIIQRSWASLIYTFRPAYATNHIFSVSYEHNKIADTVLQLNPDYYSDHSNRLDVIELNYRLEINKVNNWNYPIVGTKVVGNIFSEIGIKGLDFFNYATLEAGQYNHLFSKFYSAFIFRGKLSFPTNQAYVWRQAMGTKYEYVRGYEYYVIDGYQYGLLRSNFKFELCNFVLRKIPLRYLPAIPIKIYPKIFTDVGYVGNPTPGNSFLNNKMLYSIGAGIDLFTAYDFKIRVEYAINHLGQKGLFLHFNAE